MKTTTDMTVPCKIDQNLFTRFAFFDTFRLQRRWLRPAIFFFMMGSFSIPCFLLRKSREGALFLGIVLLGSGLLLPLAYLLSYWFSVRSRGKKLSGTRIIYTLHIRDDAITVTQGQDKIRFRWDQIYRAYLSRGDIFLYVDPHHAYLLPRSPQQNQLWGFFQQKLHPENCIKLN